MGVVFYLEIVQCHEDDDDYEDDEDERNDKEIENGIMLHKQLTKPQHIFLKVVKMHVLQSHAVPALNHDTSNMSNFAHGDSWSIGTPYRHSILFWNISLALYDQLWN